MSDVKIVRGLELTPVEKMIALAIAQHQFGIPNPVIDEFHASLAKSISTMFTERGMVVVPKDPTHLNLRESIAIKFEIVG